jgi:hypothetical protein
VAPRSRRRGGIRVVAAGAGLGLALLASACGPAAGAGPTDDERQVCDTMQRMVEQLQRGDGPAALRSLEELQVATAGTDNPTLRAAGAQLFDAIGQPVDPSGLTVEQTRELGNQVLAAGGAGLASLVNGCQAVGAPVRIDDAELRRRSGRDGSGRAVDTRPAGG